MIYYEIKVNYTRQTGEENPSAVKETYIVEGLTCADVETRLLNEIKPFISAGECEVKSCKQIQFRELIPDPTGEYWYKARVEMITVEDNGKETRKPANIYVQASTMTEALKTLQHALNNEDCEVISLNKTAIMDVLRAIN